MSHLVVCPGDTELRQFLLGEMPERLAEDVGQHVKGCSHCLTAARTLTEGDALTTALRRASAILAEQPPWPSTLARLLQQLHELRPEGPETGIELEALLAPPQRQDELGRLGRYRILGRLGQGGMGIVFQAEDLELGREVALKVLRPHLAVDPQARRRFLREARATAGLEHDHIVPIYQVGEEHDDLYLAMPLLQGETLEDRLQRSPRLPVAEIRRIGREMAEGLAAAHAAGLIHRDVKPANVWLETPSPCPLPDRAGSVCGGQLGSSPTLPPRSGRGQSEGGRVKILDFGLARAVADETHLTQSGTVAGTPGYMAPEQAQGEPVDARSDLFSLGCVLYRLCTGQLPFPGANAAAILLALTQDQPQSPSDLNPDIPPDLADLVLRLLAKDPAQRPALDQVVVEILEGRVRQPAVVQTPAGRKAPRRRWPWVVAAAAVLAGVLLLSQIILRITAR